MPDYMVKNWHKFQHYKDRNPPWVKLHYEIMTSLDWVMVSDAGKLLAVVCIMLASRDGGRVPGDPSYVKRVAYLDKIPDFQPLVKCGFLIVLADDSKPEQALANARPETEAYSTDTERGSVVSARDKKITLDELTVDHIKDWLEEKHKQGRYLNHDAAFILEHFKDYCRSRNKKYTDYVAAYRNAFEWRSCQPPRNNQPGRRKESAHDVAGRAWAAAGGIHPGKRE